MEFSTVLPRLVAAYESGRLVPFLGAGMSRPACADWPGLIRGLEEKAGIPPETKPLTAETPAADLVRRANAAVRLLKSRGPETFVEAMRAALVIPPADIPLQTRALAELWWPLALTTNYDNLFATALAERFPSRQLAVVGRSPEHCQRVLASLSTASRGLVWSLQGYLDTPCPPGAEPRTAALHEELVVGYDEYRRVTYRAIHFRRAFAEVFRQRSLLFLGSGIRDTYLQELFGEVLELYGPSARPHYALIPEGEVDPDFMLARFQIIAVEYPKDCHQTVIDSLNRLAKAVASESRPQVAWTWGRIERGEMGTGRAEDWRSVPELEIVRGPLPIKRLDEEECLAVNAGGMSGFSFSPGARQAMTGWGVQLDEQRPEEPSVHLYYWPDRHVYAVRALSDSDEPGLAYIRTAALELFTHAAQRGYRRIHMQLLATSSVEGLNDQPAARLFPERFSLVQIVRAFAERHSDHMHDGCSLILHVVEPSVFMDLASGRIDVTELLTSDDIRFWAEIAWDTGEIERRFFQRASDVTLGTVAKEINLALPRWAVEVSPPPTTDYSDALLPPGAPGREMRTVQQLGLVPGSTLHFRPVSSKKNDEAVRNGQAALPDSNGNNLER